MPEKAKASPAKAEETPTDTPAQSVAEAGEPLTLSYAEPVEVDGGLRLSATDGRGNSLSVTAADKPKAQAALRAAFKTLNGE